MTESSTATIERNDISENLKANIALGGINAINTNIIENEIHGGRCEGIFMINSGECWIIRNRIFENNDGIIGITSVPLIKKNEIFGNKNHGIMLLKDCRAGIYENEIFGNETLGLFIRDKSAGEVKNNIIRDNKIEVLV